MHISIVLTSLADSSRGETEKRQECMLLEWKRNGTSRSAFLRDVSEKIKELAKQHNAKFKAEHPA